MTTPKASPRRLIAVLHLSNNQSNAKMTAKSAAKRSRETACVSSRHLRSPLRVVVLNRAVLLSDQTAWVAAVRNS